MKKVAVLAVRKAGWVLLLVVGSVSWSFGQREVLYEQYQQNPMAINPAFTGVREDFNMTAILRRRWFFLPNAPITQTFATDGTVANGKVGLGLQALNDRMSVYATTGAYGSVAYHVASTGPVKISLGIQGGVNVLPVYDFTSNTSLSRALGSFGAGIWLRTDRFYAGVSKPELLAQGYGSRASYGIYRRPLYVLAGGQFDLAEDLKLVPQVLVVQEAGTSLRVDVGARAWYNERIGLGASFRTAVRNYLQLSGEVQVSTNVRVGYIFNSRAIEAGANVTSTGPVGMHELMLKFVPNPSGFHLN
ncbi:type IX secretion system membrane protein PorP/SprF [Telluribacter sp.]|jgi:type IX secretion system PorP/SprF family membrane protein|uniref:PorP/SprF family type IX secretion system membrane protein n=1 Tax=Telluribacter sp. TaxID=1978767 RepID=UPI002E0DA1E4|nr:type IX secretion system membrane protein PorP/SprF [Telluribacter sp.]